MNFYFFCREEHEFYAIKNMLNCMIFCDEVQNMNVPRNAFSMHRHFRKPILPYVVLSLFSCKWASLYVNGNKMPIDASWNCTIYWANICAAAAAAAAVCDVQTQCEWEREWREKTMCMSIRLYILYSHEMAYVLMLNQLYSFNVLRSNNTSMYRFGNLCGCFGMFTWLTQWIGPIGAAEEKKICAHPQNM